MASELMDDGRWSHTFRQSFLTTFTMCPEQARAEYFGEVPTDTHTDSTALGTAVHAGIEYALHEKRENVVPLPHEMYDVAVNALDGFGEWQQTKMSRQMVYTKAGIMLSAFHRDLLPTVAPEKIEHTFRLRLYSDEHREIWMSGTMDCVDEDGLVWDWKTASRPYERWEKQRWAIQPTVYCWAECAEWFRYGIMLHDGSTQILDVRRDETHADWLRTQATQVAWMIEHGLNPWPLNDAGWWCNDTWCPKWDLCKGAHMSNDWKD